MFTGIIETVGEVIDIHQELGNTHFDVRSSLGGELKIDQSLAHNGVCLTVIYLEGNVHRVTAIEETMRKSNLKGIKIGDWVNLERCMVADGRFDGHIVQGHVDQVAEVAQIQEENGSWLFDFTYDASVGNVTVEKGSICINGVSLTCFDAQEGAFRVAIIPYTYEHTNFKTLQIGDQANLEFDIIGKYVKKLLEQR